MKMLIRRWLGFTSITLDLFELKERQTEILMEIMKLRNELVVTFTDEMDPRRQAMSKELGNRIERKLIAEDKARRHTLGEL